MALPLSTDPAARKDAVQALARRARPVSLAGDHLLPVLPALAPLVGGGLRRGSTVAVAGSISLVLAVLAAPSQAGAWTAVVGLPELGAVAAAELGVVLERLALVPRPGRQWASVTAALVDAFDVVVVRPPPHLRGGDARRVVARARERGAVLVPVGTQWPGADVRLSVTSSEWCGLGAGHGHLRARRAAVTAEGRRGAARARHAWLWLPGPEGGVTVAPAPATRAPATRAPATRAPARPPAPCLTEERARAPA